MKTNVEAPYNSSEEPENISLGNLVLTIILAPLSSFCLVFFVTKGIEFIAQEQWPGVPVLWPPILYLGGIAGGTIGGIVAFLEIRANLNHKQSLTPVQLFSSDLFYLFLLMLLTYVLELLSENVVFQGIFFILEIAFFVVIGRNISRKSIEMLIMTEDPEDQKTDIETKTEI